MHRIYPKFWDTLSIYHICPSLWNRSFYCLLMYLNHFCMYGKQCRPWSDAAFCSIWSGSTLFAKAYLSQYLGLLPYISSTKYRIWPNYRTVRLGTSKLLGTLICGRICIYLPRIHNIKDQKRMYLMMIMRVFFFFFFVFVSFFWFSL